MISTQRPSSITGNLDRDDPLSAVLRPSPGETAQDRDLRLQREAEAKRVSDRIDEQINIDRERYKKAKQDVRVRGLVSLCIGSARITGQRRRSPPNWSVCVCCIPVSVRTDQ